MGCWGIGVGVRESRDDVILIVNNLSRSKLYAQARPAFDPPVLLSEHVACYIYAVFG